MQQKRLWTNRSLRATLRGNMVLYSNLMCTNQMAPPRFRRDYPLNLSISVSGGKESNSDSLSSGERNGNSPAHNLPGYQACGEMLRQGNGR